MIQAANAGDQSLQTGLYGMGLFACTFVPQLNWLLYEFFSMVYECHANNEQ